MRENGVNEDYRIHLLVTYDTPVKALNTDGKLHISSRKRITTDRHSSASRIQIYGYYEIFPFYQMGYQ